MRFLILIGLLLSLNAFGCDFCMVGQGINPYLTANGRGLTLSEDYIQSNDVYNGTAKTESHGKKEAWLIQSLTVFSALTEDLSLLATLPFTSKTNLDYDATSGSNPGVVTNGLGDASLTARYTLYKDHSLDSTWIGGLLLGVKLPTGATDLTSQGNPVDRHALPGTGSYDEILGLTGSFASAEGYLFTGDLVYNFAGRGRWNGRDHQYGNSLNLSLQGYVRISSKDVKERSAFVFTGPKLEVTGKEVGTQTDSGYQDSLVNDSSGGSIAYWSLGVYETVTPVVAVTASVAKALYHHMNFSDAFDADPAEDYKTNLTVTFLF